MYRSEFRPHPIAPVARNSALDLEARQRQITDFIRDPNRRIGNTTTRELYQAWPIAVARPYTPAPSSAPNVPFVGESTTHRDYRRWQMFRSESARPQATAIPARPFNAVNSYRLDYPAYDLSTCAPPRVHTATIEYETRPETRDFETEKSKHYRPFVPEPLVRSHPPSAFEPRPDNRDFETETSTQFKPHATVQCPARLTPYHDFTGKHALYQMRDGEWRPVRAPSNPCEKQWVDSGHNANAVNQGRETPKAWGGSPQKVFSFAQTKPQPQPQIAYPSEEQKEPEYMQVCSPLHTSPRPTAHRADHEIASHPSHHTDHHHYCDPHGSHHCSSRPACQCHVNPQELCCSDSSPSSLPNGSILSQSLTTDPNGTSRSRAGYRTSRRNSHSLWLT